MPKDISSKYIVCTGGEPGLQLDQILVDRLHKEGYEIGIETNGTVALAENLDWICVSPKANTELLITKGNELKVVIPQKEQSLNAFESLSFEHFYVQAMDGPLIKENLKLAIDFCKENPKWKLSIQTHKLLGIN